MTADFHSDRPRFRPQLTPDLSAVEGFVVVSRWLLDDIRYHEPRVRDDRHPEHLHDFRVAVRRQRSALSHFRPALDSEAIQPYREGFARLGRTTGRLRDLDVDLETRPQLLALLPDDLHAGLTPRYLRLQRRRRRELGHVHRSLNAPWYRWLIHDWGRLLDSPRPGPRGDWPATRVVRERLLRVHQRVLDHGRGITDATPDASLHRLRIRCKKLRYLLEMSSTLFPPAQIKTLVKHLKRLQNNLGEFNDLCVQWEDWRNALDQAASTTEQDAVQALLEVLGRRHERVRSEFAHRFEAFDTPAVRGLFDELLED